MIEIFQPFGVGATRNAEAAFVLLYLNSRPWQTDPQPSPP